MNFWRKHAFVGAAIAAAAAGFELVRIIVEGGEPLHGLAPLMQMIFTVLFIGTLAVGAVGLVLGRGFGWISAALGVVVALAYGSVIEASAHPWGVAYVLVGVGVLYTLMRSLHGFERTFVAGT